MRPSEGGSVSNPMGRDAPTANRRPARRAESRHAMPETGRVHAALRRIDAISIVIKGAGSPLKEGSHLIVVHARQRSRIRIRLRPPCTGHRAAESRQLRRDAGAGARSDGGVSRAGWRNRTTSTFRERSTMSYKRRRPPRPTPSARRLPKRLWSRTRQSRPRSSSGAGARLEGTVLLPANAYGGVKASAQAAFGPRRVKEWPFPFPGTTHEHILDWLDQALEQHDPRYVLLDHVSSQPAVVCPVAEMVALCRRRGIAEVAVDGAHALGQVAINVDEIGADLSQITVNTIDATLDQWLIPQVRTTSSPTSTSGRSRRRRPRCCTRSVSCSRRSSGGGRLSGRSHVGPARGTTPRCARFLLRWRTSATGGRPTASPRRSSIGVGCGVLFDDLQTAWGVTEAVHEECLGSMGMVRLPAGLDLSKDVPGQPVGPDSVRSRLRDPRRRRSRRRRLPGRGFLRLSHAVYTSDDDLERPRDAVLELVWCLV